MKSCLRLQNSPLFVITDIVRGSISTQSPCKQLYCLFVDQITINPRCLQPQYPVRSSPVRVWNPYLENSGLRRGSLDEAVKDESGILLSFKPTPQRYTAIPQKIIVNVSCKIPQITKMYKIFYFINVSTRKRLFSDNTILQKKAFYKITILLIS